MKTSNEETFGLALFSDFRRAIWLRSR